MNFSIENILRLDKKYRILILVGTLLVITIIYVYLFYIPSNSKISKLNKELDKLLAKKAEQEAIIQNLDEFKQENQQLKQTLQLAMAQLPDKREIHSLLQNISNIAREAGLKVPLFRPHKEIKKDFYAEVPVELNLIGSHGDLLTFFTRISQVPRIVNISDLRIDRDSKTDLSETMLKVSCKATTYRFLEESERPKPEDDNKKGKKKRKNR